MAPPAAHNLFSNNVIWPLGWRPGNVEGVRMTTVKAASASLALNLRAMPKIVKKLQHKTARQSARPPSFACLPDLLSHYARIAPKRRAILAPGCLPMTYDALW